MLQLNHHIESLKGTKISLSNEKENTLKYIKQPVIIYCTFNPEKITQNKNHWKYAVLTQKKTNC